MDFLLYTNTRQELNDLNSQNNMLQKFLTVWHEDVGEDARYGTDVSFEPDFEELRREVEKDTSLCSGAAQNGYMSYVSTHILQTQSKDI
jgi:hypothetical protein